MGEPTRLVERVDITGAYERERGTTKSVLLRKNRTQRETTEQVNRILANAPRNSLFRYQQLVGRAYNNTVRGLIRKNRYNIYNPL